MFCKKCGNRISDTDTVCPACGAAVDRSGSRMNLYPAPAPKAENASPAPVSAPSDDLSATAQLPVLDQGVLAEMEALAPKPEPPAEAQPAPVEPVAETDVPTPAPQPVWETSDVEDVIPPQPAPAAERAAGTLQDVKRERHSRYLLKGFVCFLAAVMIALTVTERKTDLFSRERDLVKEVPYSGFTGSEKESFLSFFTPLSALCGTTVEVPEMDRNDFLELLRPWDPAGLYAGRFSIQTKRSEPLDPRGRYPDGYYAVSEAEVSQVAEGLGVPFAGGLNTKACYSHDGVLYFDAADSAQGKQRTVIDASATRIEGGNYDGWYYVTCTCDDGSVCYCLASYDRRDADHPWTLGTVSNEELFDSGTKRELDGSAFPFEMQQQIVTAQTASGQTYAQYIVIYPLFSDADTAAAQQINALYESVVASYQAKETEGERRYARYVSRGYDLSLLPAYEYKICSVSYDRNGWISLLDETVTYRPETYAKAKLAAQTAGEPFETLPVAEEIVSGYTVNAETGEVLHTQDLLGAEDEDVWALLCNAYLGSATEDENTDGLETLGRQLYAAPWILTDSGVTFFYRDAQADYLTQFTLPYEKLPTDTFKNF